MTRGPRKPSRKTGGARRAPPPRVRLPGLAGLLALVVLLAAGGLAWTVFGPGPAPKEGGTETTVILKRGSSLPQIAETLADSGVIRLPFTFGVLAKLTGGGQRLRAGEYAVPARASAFDVLRMIRAGRIVRHLVTVPEGLSSAQVADLLNGNPVLAGEAPVAPEGSIMPQTYDVERGQDRAEVVRQMRAAQEKLVEQLWAERAPGLPYRTPQQAIAMASIVEKETAVPAERAHVAGVYLNRLEKGMRLESDPTIIYGITKGRPLGRSLTHADVTDPTPWNTYAVAGLPPTPIANPGRASIEAALHPIQTRDLYFVADGSGGHVFAETFEAHTKNVARWRTIARSLKGDKG
ncbi:MAG: endolytic transglycosylase MltG [Caulobacteraceae bacterium]